MNYQKVDHSALKTNQAMIIFFLLAAFVLNVPLLVAFVSVVMLVGSAFRQPGFKIVYTGFLKPRGLVKPDVLNDNPQPHVFAQGMGGTVLLLALVAFALNYALIGWALVWLVIALAALNVFIGFCAGCFVYYWLVRLHVPGFVAQPLPGTFPGMRPHGKAS
jgi:hypothetical protein